MLGDLILAAIVMGASWELLRQYRQDVLRRELERRTRARLKRYAGKE